MTTGFSEIQERLTERASRIVWASVTTVDTKGRPRGRILHPMWEGETAWILTTRNSFKAKHLAQNSNIALTYWDRENEQIYAEGTAEWIDDDAEKTRIWELFKATPEPYGYDPAPFWAGGPTDPTTGLLKCTWRRIELSSLGEMARGIEPIIWHNR